MHTPINAVYIHFSPSVKPKLIFYCSTIFDSAPDYYEMHTQLLAGTDPGFIWGEGGIFISYAINFILPSAYKLMV